ncbi:aminopeptidase [Buttiauxella sp. 3AFRM03]|uniref:alpha/beta hydrolase family protein n=1 Tax=Buttiauxella sp. 3AFRM03 TaxID=2479367 RepID=UPI000EF759FC|nr:prolyl oligopeptidase family serine peptidase [Buttiauxella sp. 3AFRM03]AYN29071.1 aminopeptidase [Buttiauxella sp. 3AFRM03]
MFLCNKTLLATIFTGVLLITGCDQNTPKATTEKSQVAKEDTLVVARAGFKTKIIETNFEGDSAPITPPAEVFNLIHYPAKDGAMAAFITPDPKDNVKHPAVIWLVGGYGGIGSDDFFWAEQPKDNDQTGSAFRKAGITMMIPSFRGENGNPGRYEMFYGELDDLESARSWLASQPWVDANRIYVVGHSTGGTRALLASELSDKYRAVFSLGGIPDLKKRIEGGKMMVNVPFDQTNPQEFKLRSPQFFISSIKVPTFYFEGEEYYWSEFDEIKASAKAQHIPLQVYKINGGDHFNIITPVSETIAKKILSDTDSKTSISFDATDIKSIESNIHH